MSIFTHFLHLKTVIFKLNELIFSAVLENKNNSFTHFKSVTFVYLVGVKRLKSNYAPKKLGGLAPFAGECEISTQTLPLLN